MRRTFGHFGGHVCCRSDIFALAGVQFRSGLCPNVAGSGKAALAQNEARVFYQDLLLKVLRDTAGRVSALLYRR